MAHLHFTAASEYRDRVIRMGEPPEKVFLVGGMGMDNIKRLTFLEKADFEKAIGFTIAPAGAAGQIAELLKALAQLNDTHLIFTHPSADTGYKAIVEKIQEFVRQNNGRSILIKSMGQLNYLSALRHVDAVVGNSSSGLIEAPGFHIGTLNVGHRQDGRLRAASVLDCECEEQAILNGLKTIYSDAFRHQLAGVTNPYGEGGAAEKVVAILKSIDINQLIPKTFFDN